MNVLSPVFYTGRKRAAEGSGVVLWGRFPEESDTRTHSDLKPDWAAHWRTNRTYRETRFRSGTRSFAYPVNYQPQDFDNAWGGPMKQRRSTAPVPTGPMKPQDGPRGSLDPLSFGYFELLLAFRLYPDRKGTEWLTTEIGMEVPRDRDS